jgi:hypothetical protein
MIDEYSTDSPPMPAPRLMARSMLSFGHRGLLGLEDRVEQGRVSLQVGPPSFAATSMFLMSFAHDFARRESMTAFLCLVVAHLECPDMISSLLRRHRCFSAEDLDERAEVSCRGRRLVLGASEQLSNLVSRVRPFGGLQ